MGWLQDYQQELQGGNSNQVTPFTGFADHSNPVPTTHALTTSLLSSIPNWNGVKAAAATDGKSPSNIQRILDILSRPLYASANIQKTVIDSTIKNKGIPTLNPFDYIAAGAKGLAGKDKTTSRDIFTGLGYKPTGIGGFAASFAGDVLLDPTSYIGPGVAKAIFKGGSKALGKDAAVAAEKAATNPPVAGVSDGLSAPRMTPATGALPGATVGSDISPTATALRSNKDVTRQSLDFGFPVKSINPFEKLPTNVDPNIFSKAMGNITGLVPDITKVTPYATVSHTGDVVLTNAGKEQAAALGQKLTFNRRNGRPIIDRPVERLFYNIYNSSLKLPLPKSNLTHMPDQSFKDVLNDTSKSVNLRTISDAPKKEFTNVTPAELHKYLIEGDGISNAAQLEVKIGTQYHNLEQLRTTALSRESAPSFKAANDAAAQVHPEQFLLQHVQDLLNVRTSEVNSTLSKWRTGAKTAGVPEATISKIEKSVQSFRQLGYSPQAIREITPQLIDHYSPLAPLAERLAKTGQLGRQAAGDTAQLARVGIVRPTVVKAADIVEAAKTGDTGAQQVIHEAALATKPSVVAHDITPAGQGVIDTLTQRVAGLIITSKNKTFNPAKQANAFRELERNLVLNGDVMPKSFNLDAAHLATSKNIKIATIRKSLAMKHLAAFEDAMIKAGHNPVLWDGTPMRLSQLIEKAGGIKALGSGTMTDLFKNHAAIKELAAKNPLVAQAIEESKAAHAINQATTANEAATAAVESAAKVHADPLATAADGSFAESLAPKVAKEIAGNAGADSIGQKLAGLQATNIFKSAAATHPFIAATQRTNTIMVEEALSAGDSASAGAVGAARIHTEAAHATAGIRSEDIAIEISKAEDSKANVGLTARIKSMLVPDFGKEDLHPYFLKHFSIGQSNPKIIESAINEMAKRYTVAEFNAGFKFAQNGLSPATMNEAAAGNELRNLLENVFTTSGIGNKTKNNTFVLREGIKIKYLNDSLRRKGAGDFQFSNKVTDHNGAVLKLKNPLDSWRYHNPESPQLFVAQLRQAADDVAMEKAMYDEMGTVFGSKVATQDMRYTVKHKYLTGVYFSKDHAQQASKVIQHLTELRKPTNENLRYYDIGLRIWKSGVTIYSPSHHVRNIIGDMYLSWGDGLRNPKYYRRSAHIIRLKKNYYTDVIGSENLVSRDPAHLATSLARPVNPKLVVATLKNGTKLDGNMAFEAAYREGILPHSGVIEDTEFGNSINGLPKPFGDKVGRKVRAFGESREHYPRMAHFLHALESETGTTAEVFRKAGMRVRKWHPDGSDLTIDEKRVMRRVFPFYSWTRKAIPLAVEMALRSPAKVTVIPKAMFNLASAMGVNPQSLSQPFDINKMYPNWISDLAMGPTIGNTILGNNLDPVTSLGEQFANNPGKGALNSLTPFLKIPLELTQGRETLNNAPIKDKTAYIDKQVPFLSVLNRAFNTDIGAGSGQALLTGNNADQLGTKVQSGNANAGPQTAPILNWLTGIGMIDTQSKSNLKSAQFDQAARVKALRKKNG